MLSRLAARQTSFFAVKPPNFYAQLAYSTRPEVTQDDDAVEYFRRRKTEWKRRQGVRLAIYCYTLL